MHPSGVSGAEEIVSEMNGRQQSMCGIEMLLRRMESPVEVRPISNACGSSVCCYRFRDTGNLCMGRDLVLLTEKK